VACKKGTPSTPIYRVAHPGGILPASMKDIPLDFDTLQHYECFIAFSSHHCFGPSRVLPEMPALNMMRFFAHESCGQCTPCRVGTTKAAQLMQAKVWDNPTLEDLNQVMADASICQLRQAAPNPVRCVQKYFPLEIV
jgi:formate dehydrogenase